MALNYPPATAGTPVNANQIEDYQTYINNHYHDDLEMHISPIPDPDKVNCTWSGAGYLSATSGGALASVPATFATGDRIKEIKFKGHSGGGGAGTITIRLRHVPDSGQVSIDSLSQVDPAASWADVTKALTTPHIVTADGAYYITVELGTANFRIKDIRIVYDRPAP